MAVIESFTYNNSTYPKGTVIYRNKDGVIEKELFMYWYPLQGQPRGRYMVFMFQSGTKMSHPADLFFRDIVRIEKPTTQDMQKLAEFERSINIKNKQSLLNDEGVVFFLIFALVVASVLFPPIGIIAMFYAVTRKK